MCKCALSQKPVLPLIHNQNLKKSAHYSWDIFQEKLAVKCKVLWLALWVGDPGNFDTSFFVKNYYLNLNFFQALQSTLLKNGEKKFAKMLDANHLKVAWHSEKQKKNIEK